MIALGISWLYASDDQLFYVVGLSEPWSTILGPALSAVSAGIVIALVFSLVDSAAGLLAASIAAVLVLFLPGFLTLHHDSLNGPPLLAVTLMTLGVMIHAPRWSIAYGALAAIGAVFIAPAGFGLPIAAVVWAMVGARKADTGTMPRVAFALLPLALALIICQWTGDAWLEPARVAWRGQLDIGLQAAGTVIGDQLAPTITTPALRWFAIADLTLIAVALVWYAWQQVSDTPKRTSSRRTLAAIAVVFASHSLGLAILWVLVPSTGLPRLETVFPVAVLSTIAIVVSTALLWKRWPIWGKATAIVIAVGWFQAAIRT